MLFAASDLPLHFLKVLDFSDLDETLTKPQQLFLYLLFDHLLDSTNKDGLRTLFQKSLYPKKQKKAKALMKGLEEEEDGDMDDAESEEEPANDEERHLDFKKGLSEYLLTKFYVKKKRESESGKLEGDLKDKFKAIFDIINK